MALPNITPLKIIILLITLQEIHSSEEGYLRYVKDGCFIRGEALNCVKYKALKIAKTTIFGDNMYSNKTIRASKMISFVPLDEETIKGLAVKEEAEVLAEEPRSILSEWSELAKYLMKLVKDFFKMKGLRVDLPEGARTIEEQDVDTNDDGESEGRGRKKKLALIVPLLTLLAALKTKLLLIPILLAVLLIKKLLIIAALLLPSLLNTLKHCKHKHHYSYFGGNDASDFSSDYGSTYSYGTGGGYSKDWALNRAYTMPKPRPTPSPVYITAPGAVAK